MHVMSLANFGRFVTDLSCEEPPVTRAIRRARTRARSEFENSASEQTPAKFARQRYTSQNSVFCPFTYRNFTQPKASTFRTSDCSRETDNISIGGKVARWLYFLFSLRKISSARQIRETHIPRRFGFSLSTERKTRVTHGWRGRSPSFTSNTCYARSLTRDWSDIATRRGGPAERERSKTSFCSSLSLPMPLASRRRDAVSLSFILGTACTEPFRHRMREVDPNPGVFCPREKRLVYWIYRRLLIISSMTRAFVFRRKIGRANKLHENVTMLSRN